MKKLVGILLTLLLTATCLLGLFACGDDGSSSSKKGLLYKKDKTDGYYVITGYVDENKGVTSLDLDQIVKAKEGADAVIGEIKPSAFKNNDTLKEVIVPDTVVKIGAGAFAGMRKLESLTLPFVGATRNADAFYGETGTAEDKSVDEERLFAYVFSEEAFNYGAPVTFNYDASNTKTYYLPMTLKTVNVNPRASQAGEKDYAIPMYAFCGNAQIEKINLGENVLGIGDCAFKNSVALTTIITENVAKLGQSAFEGCTNLNYYGDELNFADDTIYLMNLTIDNIKADAFAKLNKLVNYRVISNIVNLDFAFTDSLYTL
jgi:hypothetical protein